ncbi:MAG: hypothetical protein RLY86_1655 [Pseudomonadota bacterium]|jgi:chemotaxis protein methyltransferase CheR
MTDAATVAGLVAQRLGLAPDGPVAERLAAQCRTLSPDRLAMVRLAAIAPGLHAELLPLIDGATNRETYFFRDPKQLSALEAALRINQAADRAAPLSLWSAGCASGEEAFTLSVIARRLRPDGRGIAVLGTDIAAAALETARAGRYRTGPMSPLRGVAVETAPWLRPDGPGHARVAEEVRAPVRFLLHNLLEAGPGGGPFSAICCRNVLLYMTTAARRRALAVLAEALAPGGWLLLGSGDHAPVANPVDAGLAAVEIEGYLLFRKPAP